MYDLLLLALAPVTILCVYIYIRDKYEREPIRLLLTGLIFGAIITAPIIHVENFVTLFAPNAGLLWEAFFLSFFVASLVEESFKYIILFFLVWKNNNFNERLDGIVYSVFISLGFAAVENVLYVFNPYLGGLHTGLARAFISVPAHAFFGVVMGYHFALSKFDQHSKGKHFFYAFFMPFLLHGIYDFILMSNLPYLMVFFTAFVIYLWISGFKKISALLLLSPFKNQS